MNYRHENRQERLIVRTGRRPRRERKWKEEFSGIERQIRIKCNDTYI